jgi:hypothetical protein
LPLAFRMFMETVGSVELSGKHRDWPHRLLDPLMFEASADYYVDTYADRVEEGDLDRTEPFDVDFAPDDLHKADISGARPTRSGRRIRASTASSSGRSIRRLS